MSISRGSVLPPCPDSSPVFLNSLLYLSALPTNSSSIRKQSQAHITQYEPPNSTQHVCILYVYISVCMLHVYEYVCLLCLYTCYVYLCVCVLCMHKLCLYITECTCVFCEYISLCACMHDRCIYVHVCVCLLYIQYGVHTSLGFTQFPSHKDTKYNRCLLLTKCLWLCKILG